MLAWQLSDIVPTIMNQDRRGLYSVFADFFPHCIEAGVGVGLKELNEMAYDMYERVAGPNAWVSEGLAGCNLLEEDPNTPDFNVTWFRTVMVEGLALSQVQYGTAQHSTAWCREMGFLLIQLRLGLGPHRSAQGKRSCCSLVRGVRSSWPSLKLILQLNSAHSR